MQKEGDFYICDRRLYLTSDKKQVVEERDNRAALLYATPGTRIPAAFAEAQGLVQPEAPKPAEEKAVPQTETQNKARKAPVANKKRK